MQNKPVTNWAWCSSLGALRCVTIYGQSRRGSLNIVTQSLLVTGGAGFIGVNFVNHWAQAHPEHTLVVLDALTYAGNRASLAPLEGSCRIEFV